MQVENMYEQNTCRHVNKKEEPVKSVKSEDLLIETHYSYKTICLLPINFD